MKITFYACLRLDALPNASFYVKELDIDTIVDFADSIIEAGKLCMMAEMVTGKSYKFYETSLESMNIMRQYTREAIIKLRPTNPTQVIGIDNIDMERVKRS